MTKRDFGYHGRMISVAEALREGAFSRSIPERAREELARICAVETFPADTLLFKEGEDHARIYLIWQGSVVLDMHVPGRGQVRILSVGPGELLGCSPVCGERRMTARATTHLETVALVIPADQLMALCLHDHEVGYHVMREAACAMQRRLLATRLQLLDLFAETTPDPTAGGEPL